MQPMNQEDDITQGKAEVLAKVRVRFTIDVDLTVFNLPDVLLKEKSKVRFAKTEDNPKYLAFQEKLLLSVLANPDTFQAVAVREAGYEASKKFEEQWIYANSEEDRLKSLIKETAKSCLTIEDWKDVEAAANEEDILSEILQKLSDSWRTIPGDISIQMVVQK
jgi:hypothetical protein